MPSAAQLNDLTWRGVVVTPDGRAAVIVEELADVHAPVEVRDRLPEASVATGRATALKDLKPSRDTSTSRSCTPALAGARWSSPER